MKAVFLRVLEAEDKSAALLAAVREPEVGPGKQRFEVDTATFRAVPCSPFAYWLSHRVRELFLGQALEAPKVNRIARRGVGTNDDFRFLRLWFEVQSGPDVWVSLAKGGVFSRFYASLALVLNWREVGAQLRAFFIQGGESPSRNIRSESEYSRPGLTWPLRTQGGLSVRIMPAGCIFGSKGPAVFVKNDDTDKLLALLAITNSRPFRALVEVQMAFGSYEVGVIQRTPVPNVGTAAESILAMQARTAWSLKRTLDARIENSHAFLLPALLQVEGETLAASIRAWMEFVGDAETKLDAIQEEIDSRCFGLYGIDETDRQAITKGFIGNASDAESSGDADEAEDDANGAGGEGVSADDAANLVAELVSWAVGVAFGRFDVRLATKTRPLPAEPGPFDPLPSCSAGMLTGDDSRPVSNAPTGYPLAFPEAGVLVDDPGHAHDLPTRVRTVFDVVFGVAADRRWNDVAALLEPKSNDLRVWLADSFFEYHLKRYSKSRRKAPILWQLGTLLGRYSVWLYAHRLTRDSFFQLQNDVVGPKLTHEERQLTSLVQGAGASPSSKDRKEIATQTAFVGELRTLLDEVKRVTPLWNPTLDDGVVLVMAPLWRLVPQHKPWQKELKSKWDELVHAKYDWAQTAMHLWPERVVPKCATDRSLAIAHGLEDVFWAEGADGKWKPRSIPTRSIDDLVRVRSSPGVKAALKMLLDAPVAGRTATRTRKAKHDD